MSDRETLNGNFVSIYKEMEETGTIAGLESLLHLAEVLDIDLKLLRAYIRGEHFITFKEAYHFCKVYNISERRMFEGIDNYAEKIIGSSLTPTTEAIGGHALPDSPERTVLFVKRPGQAPKGNKIAFKVVGSSMMPTYTEGQQVYGRKIEQISEIKDGRVYIVITSEHPRIKRIYKEGKKRLRLESDNPEYEDDFVDLIEFPNIQIYEVSPQFDKKKHDQALIREEKRFKLNILISENKIDLVCQLLMKGLGFKDSTPAIIRRAFLEIQKNYQNEMIKKENKREEEVKIIDRLYSFLESLTDEDWEKVALK